MLQPPHRVANKAQLSWPLEGVAQHPHCYYQYQYCRTDALPGTSLRASWGFPMLAPFLSVCHLGD